MAKYIGLLSFYLTKGNLDDQNPKHITKITEQLFGKLFADKEYLSKILWEILFAYGIQLFTKLRKNMKNHIMKIEDKILIRKRATVKTINDELRNRRQIQYIRDRSINNFMMNILGNLTACLLFLPKKPSINLQKVNDSQLFLSFA